MKLKAEDIKPFSDYVEAPDLKIKIMVMSPATFTIAIDQLKAGGNRTEQVKDLQAHAAAKPDAVPFVTNERLPIGLVLGLTEGGEVVQAYNVFKKKEIPA